MQLDSGRKRVLAGAARSSWHWLPSGWFRWRGIDWWGGWCFGPRYFTDLLPFLAWFLVPVWASIRARPVLRVAFAATVAIALWVQVVGAFYYPAGNWDGSPVDVDARTAAMLGLV